MNMGVHGLMYSYFAIQSLGMLKLPKAIPVAITTLQIVQMVAGVAINGRRRQIYRKLNFEDFAVCLTAKVIHR